jgi:hypothetical protein
MAPTHRQEIAAILAGARAERTALLSRLSPALRASLPVDATGITQAIEHLGELAGRSDELRRRQARAHQANPAVLHGRVFGRAPLSPETVTAAFVEGARVRAGLLAELAGALGATDQAASFYAARGWRRWAGPTSALTPQGIVRTAEEDGGIHVLPGPAALDLSAPLVCDWRDGDVW